MKCFFAGGWPASQNLYAGYAYLFLLLHQGWGDEQLADVHIYPHACLQIVVGRAHTVDGQMELLQAVSSRQQLTMLHGI
jgi:hypothetical protein